MQSSPDIQGFMLPVTVDPADSICIQIPVPNDPGHIAAFIGVLYDLTLWTSWQRDPTHKAIQAAQVWKQIWNEIVNQSTFGNCPENVIPIAESEYDMSLCEQLRFQNGQLQALCCGVWTNISGQSAQGIGNGGQPGAGAGVPAPGGCQSYQAVMNASDQWLCPAVVNAGDTVQITADAGAWNDGAINWYCPTGQQFFAGACTTTTSLNGADPLPTQPHMCLLTKIAGVYHNISDGIVFTVPGGVVNALLILQANDATLSDNSGQISFTVKVCNNQPTTFTHVFDFTTGPHGWTPIAAGDGTWVPGVGWQSQASGANELLDITGPVVAAHTENYIEVVGSAGNAANGGTRSGGTVVSGALTGRVTIPTPAGAFDVAAGGYTAAGVTAVRAIVDTSNNGHISNVISSVIVRGIGADPYASY